MRQAGLPLSLSLPVGWPSLTEGSVKTNLSAGATDLRNGVLGVPSETTAGITTYREGEPIPRLSREPTCECRANTV